MFKRLFVLLILLCMTRQILAIQHFQASIEESRWVVQSSPVRCELNHSIPRYGYGSFVHSSGGELSFVLNAMQPSAKDSVANMFSVPPFWKAGAKKELAQLSLAKGGMPFYISRDLALRMLYELDAGMMPTFQYKDWADQTDDVLVALSSANFHDALPVFQKCISQLLSIGFDDLKDVSVYFSENKFALTTEAKRSLEELALFASNDPKMSLLVEGYTDSRGSRRYNKQLSNRRALAVEKYLVSKGVSKEQIIRRSYGEGTPKESNRTSKGRASNRRVDVVIRRI